MPDIKPTVKDEVTDIVKGYSSYKVTLRITIHASGRLKPQLVNKFTLTALFP